MKIKCIFTKDEFEVLTPFFENLSQKVEVLYPIGTSLMCEFELTGESAHILFHAGIEYFIRKKDLSTIK